MHNSITAKPVTTKEPKGLFLRKHGCFPADWPFFHVPFLEVMLVSNADITEENHSTDNSSFDQREKKKIKRYKIWPQVPSMF